MTMVTVLEVPVLEAVITQCRMDKVRFGQQQRVESIGHAVYPATGQRIVDNKRLLQLFIKSFPTALSSPQLSLLSPLLFSS